MLVDFAALLPVALQLGTAAAGGEALAQNAQDPATGAEPASGVPTTPAPGASAAPAASSATTPAGAVQTNATLPTPETAEIYTQPSPTVDYEKREWDTRTMKGTTFLYPTLQDTSFIPTYIGLRAGITSSDFPDLPTPSTPRSLSVIGATEGLDLGFKITDWFGIQGTAAGRAVVGSNIPGLVYKGATWSWGGHISAIFRLVRNESTGTQLSARAGIGGSTGQVTSLAPLFSSPDALVGIRTILDGNLGETLHTPTKSANARVSLHVAQTIGQIFTFQATAMGGRNTVRVEPWDTNIGERVKNDKGGWEYNFAAAFTIDGARKGFPLALMLEYALTRDPAVAQSNATLDADTISHFGVGVYYTGQRHLQLGITGVWEAGQGVFRSDQGSSGDPTTKGAQFILRYTW